MQESIPDLFHLKLIHQLASMIFDWCTCVVFLTGLIKNGSMELCACVQVSNLNTVLQSPVQCWYGLWWKWVWHVRLQISTRARHSIFSDFCKSWKILPQSAALEKQPCSSPVWMCFKQSLWCPGHIIWFDANAFLLTDDRPQISAKSTSTMSSALFERFLWCSSNVMSLWCTPSTHAPIFFSV